MKSNLLMLVVGLLVGNWYHAQCDVAVTLNQYPVTCADSQITFMGYATSQCPFAGTYNYSWMAYTDAGQGVSSPIDELTVSGTAVSGTSFPQFVIPVDAYTYAQVCLQVIYLDADGVQLDEVLVCQSSINLPQPLVVTASIANNSCGQPSCLAQFMATGGTAPYTYLLSNGQVISPSFWNCFDVAGTYVLTAVDANGCEGSTSFTIAVSETNNATCETAQLMENGVVTYDTLCTIDQEPPSCAAFNYAQSGWYSFNSEDYSHANLAFYSGYGNGSSGTTGFNYPSAIEVYQANAVGDCGSAELIMCYVTPTGAISGSAEPMCLDLADSIALQPNTTYFIKYMTQWTSWIPVQGMVMLTHEPIAPICGCTDNTSCNYDPDASIPDGSCGWSGCMDPGACNYQQWVTCDNGSCVYGSDINGIIFHDVNGDGIRQTWQPAEPLLSNIGVITIEELGVLIYPDANGQFTLPDIPQATYTVSFEDPNGFWLLNAGGSIQITLPTCNGLSLPLIPASEAMAQISGLNTWEGTTIHCAGGFNPGIYLYNNGNLPISGTFSMLFDSSLTYTDAPWAGTGVTVESPTETQPGLLTWTIDNQPAGSLFYYQVHIIGPGAATTGQSFPFSFTLTLNDAAGGVFYNNEWNINPFVTCSYDPNDKQATPAGWTEQHFIEAGEELEYRIRFQNTGNAPAFNVRIEDQIDISKLDLNTFSPIAASHSYSTIVTPDGMVQFVFDNILLPDSVHDEPNSHGWVVYRIRTFDSLLPLNVIDNSAAIYFDDNDPVITNTYSHTIFSCDLIPEPNGVSSTCQYQSVLLNIFPELDYTETYNWTLEGEGVSSEVMYDFPAYEPGNFEIVLNRTNPFCNEYDTLNVEVWPVPDNTLNYDGSVPMFTAPEGTSWQWLFSGEQMPGENSQSLIVSETGWYSVITTNQYGCATLSEELPFFELGIDSDNSSNQLMYPNPAEGLVNFYFADGVQGLRVVNTLGQQVFADGQARGLYQFDCSSWSSGVYRVECGNGEAVTLIVR